MILESAIRIIQLWEQFRETPYQDGAGIWTIGYGTTFYPNGEPVRESDPPLSEFKAIALLKDYLSDCATTLHNTYADWSLLLPNQKIALLSFSYNTGYSVGDGHHDTLDRALLSNLRDVPDALMLYVDKGTQDELGLTRRRYCEGLVWMGHDVDEAYMRASEWLPVPTAPDELPQADEKVMPTTLPFTGETVPTSELQEILDDLSEVTEIKIPKLKRTSRERPGI